MRVLMIEPGKEPFVTEIGNDLKSMQKAVGGLIEVVNLEENVVIVDNEEGKCIGLEGNRRVGRDIIAGTFFICGLDTEGELAALSDEQIEKYSERFKESEHYTDEEVEDAIYFEVYPLRPENTDASEDEDTWKRGGDRTNTNMVIMGVAGVGKSTAIKHIALSEYMKGTKIIFIDPEREYKELCEALEGDWINAGGGRGGMLNPLQIRPAPYDEDDEQNKLYKDEGNGLGDMVLHIKNLEIFFNLYLPSLTDMQKAILKECLIELYNQFGIIWTSDISKLSNADFPVFSDLYKLISKKAAEKEQTRKESEINVYADLACLLKDIAEGSDSFLWNGHSTLQADSNCICLDTHDLQNTSDNIKRTQYFNILTWCWEQMSRNRTERVLLIADEAYLMIDPHVPQSLVFLRNVAKRARKYEAGIAIISHSVVDFLDESIRMYGQALLDIPCFKILMGCDGKNLQETKDLYNLTEAEEELLASKKRGNALVMIGSKRLHVVFEIPEYKFKFMGKVGGR